MPTEENPFNFRVFGGLFKVLFKIVPLRRANLITLFSIHINNMDISIVVRPPEVFIAFWSLR
jgi:hypothetical protein